MDKSTKKRATITQVAKHAGVSVGTVSNYLNGTAGVSHDRAARIQQAIDVLDYIRILWRVPFEERTAQRYMF